MFYMKDLSYNSLEKMLIRKNPRFNEELIEYILNHYNGFSVDDYDLLAHLDVLYFKYLEDAKDHVDYLIHDANKMLENLNVEINNDNDTDDRSDLLNLSEGLSDLIEQIKIKTDDVVETNKEYKDFKDFKFELENVN